VNHAWLRVRLTRSLSTTSELACISLSVDRANSIACIPDDPHLLRSSFLVLYFTAEPSRTSLSGQQILRDSLLNSLRRTCPLLSLAIMITNIIIGQHSNQSIELVDLRRELHTSMHRDRIKARSARSRPDGSALAGSGFTFTGCGR
jgi:hypothetical protein